MLAKINHCPLHWHDSIELIAVIEGSIRVKDGFEEHYLNKGDVIVINRDDLHAIYSTDESNLIITLDIDIKYFEDRYSNIKDTIIVCDSNTDRVKYSKQLELIFLSALNLYNHCNNNEYTTENEIETQTVNLLELLINDFRNLRIFEDKFISLGCNDDHAKILGDIMDYIYNNFTSDISLDDISNAMNFSKYYIAHVIKDMSGLTFTEFINMLRVEDSEKLLLTTRKSISDIAYQCGFSDVKYYNKHFERWYHVTPGVHRRKYQTQNQNDTSNQYLDFNFMDALDKINAFLMNAGYDVFTKGVPIQIKFSETTETGSNLTINRLKQFKLDFSDFNTFIFNRTVIENAIRELKLDTVIIKDVVLVHSHSEHNLHNGMYDQLFDVVYENNLKPIFQIVVLDNPLKKNIQTEMRSLFDKLAARYGVNKLSNIVFELLTDTTNNRCRNNSTNLLNIINTVSKDVKVLCVIKPFETQEDSILANHCHDTIHIFPSIIKNMLKNNNSFNYSIKLIESNVTSSKMFSGDHGLITYNGLKKASYHLYYLLSKLGETIIEKSEHYILAKSKTAYQILLFNFPKEMNFPLQNDNDKNGNYCAINNIIINFDNSSYRIIRYIINSDNGSVYNAWSNYGSPEYLSQGEEKLFDRISFPKVEFAHLNRGQTSFEVKSEPYSVELLEITKI
jgi:AraC-like DNA-binding protein